MKIALIGTGAWATALAQVLADNGHRPYLYGIAKDQIDDINLRHVNTAYFKDKKIHEGIKATLDLKQALKGAHVVVLAVPTPAMETVLKNLVSHLSRKVTIVNVAKGFSDDNRRMSEIIKEMIPNDMMFPLVSLIGPSHAEEVIERHLTSVTATSLSRARGHRIARLFSNNYFRVYIQTDEVGAELGVAMKNVIAIASGIIEGLGLGDNARAALVTRGLAEMSSFGTHFGGRLKTYLGLTGLGDLAVTCYSFHSRNFKAGLEIGKADGAKAFLAANKTTVEGLRAAKTIHELAQANRLSVPIVDAVYRVIYEDVRPSQMVSEMMSRPLKEE